MLQLKTKGFTLIELLIVVAIIAILAAIAIPNFLAAQTRSKVARCMADMVALATAATAYQVDNGSPFFTRTNLSVMGDPVPAETWHYITTPIAYMSGFAYDPFYAGHPDDVPWYYYDSSWAPAVEVGPTNYYDGSVGHNREYDGWNTPGFDPTAADGNPYPYLANGAWCIIGYGPDGIIWDVDNVWGAANPDLWGVPYDPSNGTVSFGDIIWRSDYGTFMK